MAVKKTRKTKTAKKPAAGPKKAKPKAAKKPAKKPAKQKAKPRKAPAAKQPAQSYEDTGLIIVEEDDTVDREKINEERRAYLEEARSQDASD